MGMLLVARQQAFEGALREKSVGFGDFVCISEAIE